MFSCLSLTLVPTVIFNATSILVFTTFLLILFIATVAIYFVLFTFYHFALFHLKLVLFLKWQPPLFSIGVVFIKFNSIHAVCSRQSVPARIHNGSFVFPVIWQVENTEKILTVLIQNNNPPFYIEHSFLLPSKIILNFRLIIFILTMSLYTVSIKTKNENAVMQCLPHLQNQLTQHTNN